MSVSAGVIRRDLTTASRRTYDLAVIGGGIHGTFLALEAARRGYSALLLERADFGGATSWNSQRIVHGGLRYLQSLDLPRYRESVRDRRWFLRCYPELVRPLASLMPLYGAGMRRRSVLRNALRLNDLLSLRRNVGVTAESCIPKGRILDVSETAELFPASNRAGLQGGALWYDASLEDAPRLLIELLRWACSYGATCVNYVRVVELEHAEGAVTGVHGLDRITGQAIFFRAAAVAMCAGPWTADLASQVDPAAPRLAHQALAVAALIDRPPVAPVTVAVSPPASFSSASPTYFLRPWHEGMFVGTRYFGRSDGEDHGPTEPEIEVFLNDLNLAVPGLELARSDVARTYSGILPAKRAGSTQLATRDVIHAHRTTGGPKGLVSVVGVKYTTARSVAERTLRVLFGKRLTPAPPACEGRPDPAARISLPEFLALERDRPKEALEYVRRLQQEEAAQCGEDIVLRRTDWANVLRSDPNLIGRVADSLGIPASLEKAES